MQRSTAQHSNLYRNINLTIVPQGSMTCKVIVMHRCGYDNYLRGYKTDCMCMGELTVAIRGD